MATSTDPIATSAGMALPSVVTAGGRVITLHPEIVDVVLELLGDKKGALSCMMCTSKSMFDHTIKFFWKTATLEMLSKLPSTPRNRRQRYAGAICEINITMKPKLEGLCFTGPGFGQDVKVAWEALHENRKPNMAYYNVYPLAPLVPKFLQ
ncbi:hypothetical protein KCU73_g10522, partial [Aureobasidium melanogenum]